MKIRVVAAEELPMDATHERGALSFTVQEAIDFRGGRDLLVLEDEERGQAMAGIVTPNGVITVLGNRDPKRGTSAVYDAVTRLATRATQPIGRDERF